MRRQKVLSAINVGLTLSVLLLIGSILYDQGKLPGLERKSELPLATADQLRDTQTKILKNVNDRIKRVDHHLDQIDVAVKTLSRNINKKRG